MNIRGYQCLLHSLIFLREWSHITGMGGGGYNMRGGGQSVEPFFFPIL